MGKPDIQFLPINLKPGDRIVTDQCTAEREAGRKFYYLEVERTLFDNDGTGCISYDVLRDSTRYWGAPIQIAPNDDEWAGHRSQMDVFGEMRFKDSSVWPEDVQYVSRGQELLYDRGANKRA